MTKKKLSYFVAFTLGVVFTVFIFNFMASKPSQEGPSPVKAFSDRGVYYPGTEDLAPDEMRVIALGSGMPMLQMKQATACFLIELGNGDKFIFDMGIGSLANINALGIPLDYLDKVFVSHLHMDHMGDLPAFYILGPQNNRSVSLKVWGPGGGGTRPEWGTKAALEHMEETWAWMIGTLAGTIDTTSFKLEVTEFDWSKVNNIIYNKNGAVIKTIPAIHFEQSVSFILEWNGLKLAFSGDTVPNKWWTENAKGADIAIHECFLTPNQAIAKWRFSPAEAINALTKVHATAILFGKAMAMTEPKHAVAYHFQNDPDLLPGVIDAVKKVYDDPVDYAQDFMVWNVTKDGTRTRMAVPNPRYFPFPPLHEKNIESGDDRYQTPQWVLDGWSKEALSVVEQIYKEFNKEHGTDFKFKEEK